jgi:hypothetical protein
VVLEDTAAGVELDAVGATQSGQKVTEMLPIALVTVSGIIVDDRTAWELVAGAAALELGTPGKLVDIGSTGMDNVADENGAGPADETTERMLLATLGTLTAGTDELIAAELYGRAVELAAACTELDTTEVLAEEVGG